MQSDECSKRRLLHLLSQGAGAADEGAPGMGAVAAIEQMLEAMHTLNSVSRLPTVTPEQDQSLRQTEQAARNFRQVLNTLEEFQVRAPAARRLHELCVRDCCGAAADKRVPSGLPWQL